MKALLFLLSFVVAVAGCGKPQPLIVLDSWWDIDYAKQLCKGRNPCFPDPVQGVRDFETELATQFAAQTTCHLVQFVRFNGPDNADKTAIDATNKEHWSLSLNFMPGTPKQQWQMDQSANKAIVMHGAGTPSDIAKEVCSIVNGHGATVAN